MPESELVTARCDLYQGLGSGISLISNIDFRSTKVKISYIVLSENSFFLEKNLFFNLKYF